MQVCISYNPLLAEARKRAFAHLEPRATVGTARPKGKRKIEEVVAETKHSIPDDSSHHQTPLFRRDALPLPPLTDEQSAQMRLRQAINTLTEGCVCGGAR